MKLATLLLATNLLAGQGAYSSVAASPRGREQNQKLRHVAAAGFSSEQQYHRASKKKKKDKKKDKQKKKARKSQSGSSGSSSSSSEEEDMRTCDEAAGGFLGIEGLPPWVYPFPRLLAGLNFATGTPAAALNFPLTTSDAQVQDWSFNTASCKWSNVDLAPRFRLSFVDGSISAVEILADPALISGAEFYTDTGLGVFFRDNEAGTVAISDQVGTTHPDTFDVRKPTVGTKITIDYLNGVDGYGVDFMGLRPTSGVFGCAFNTCNAEGCIESSKEATNGSTEEDVGAASTIHLFWGLDPADTTMWAPCQGPAGECPTSGCTCCGTPDDFFSGHCPAAWPPTFPE